MRRCLLALWVVAALLPGQVSLQERLAGVQDNGQRSSVLQRALQEFRESSAGLRGFVQQASEVLVTDDPVVRYWRAVALSEMKLLGPAMADAQFLLHADPNAAALRALEGDLLLLSFERKGALLAFSQAGDLRRAAWAQANALQQRMEEAHHAQLWTLLLGICAACSVAWLLWRAGKVPTAL